METVAAIVMLLATVGLLALMVAATRGLRLPVRLFRPRTWTSAMAVTGTIGGAVALGAIFAHAETFGATAIGSRRCCSWSSWRCGATPSPSGRATARTHSPPGHR